MLNIWARRATQQISVNSRRLLGRQLHRSVADIQPFNENVIESPHGPCELPTTNLVQRFFQIASLWPNRVAVECGLTGKSFSYDRMRTLIRRFGSCLTRMGFKKGDVLGIVLPNVPEFLIVLHGSGGIGMPVSLVNPIYTAEEIVRQLQLVEAKAVVGTVAMAETLRQVARKCPSIRRMILVGGSEEGFVSIADMFEDSGDLFDDNFDIDINEDIFALPSSSGTTGLPKSVMLTHGATGTNIQQVMHPGTSHIRRATADFQEVFVGVLPFFHCYGLNNVLLIAMESGSKIVTLPKFEMPTFLTAVENAQPTAMHLVPPLMALLSQNTSLNAKSFSRLHTIFSGAAPMGPTVAYRMLERFNRPDLTLQEGYGMTETGPCSHLCPLTGAKIGSIGHPVSRTRAKIVDVETGEALGPNQTGELCVQGPQTMKGYLKNVKATEETLEPSGWLHTGDIAYYDDDRHFYIVDRLKELIKVKGFQVAPSELEDLIRRHPAVSDVAVIGIPDDYAGELPRAYVVTKSDATLTEEALKDFLHPKVSPHKYLKGGVHFVESIPKSNTGKILRRELKAALLTSA